MLPPTAAGDGKTRLIAIMTRGYRARAVGDLEKGTSLPGATWPGHGWGSDNWRQMRRFPDRRSLSLEERFRTSDPRSGESGPSSRVRARPGKPDTQAENKEHVDGQPSEGLRVRNACENRVQEGDPAVGPNYTDYLVCRPHAVGGAGAGQRSAGQHCR